MTDDGLGAVFGRRGVKQAVGRQGQWGGAGQEQRLVMENKQWGSGVGGVGQNGV